jgi:hypothetical protein
VKTRPASLRAALQGDHRDKKRLSALVDDTTGRDHARRLKRRLSPTAVATADEDLAGETRQKS